jgi:ABC-2 type transport system permease protein
MNIQPILIRRELWEHRALWIVPLVVAGLVVIAALFPHAAIQIDDDDVAAAQKHVNFFAQFHTAMTVPQFLLLAIILPYYLLECLYAERKDRSILFWKSLPVSDAQTVLSKLIVALVVVPLGVYALTLVTDMAASAILAGRLGNSPVVGPLLRWDMGIWLQTQGFILAALSMVVLWYAPIAAYLLVVSAWARRNVMLWAILPPLLAFIAERIAFHTNYVGTLLGYRMNGVWHTIAMSKHFSGNTHPVGADAMRQLAPFVVLQNIDLWLGLVATAALVWLAIRIRRHQSES